MNGESQAVVLRLRGLPSKATQDDVVAFFGGLGLHQVHVQQRARRATVEAYVVVKCLEDAQRACARDKDIFHPKFGERYVRVSIAEDMSPADLLALISSGAAAATSKVATCTLPADQPRHALASQQKTMDSVVKVTGLPSGITCTDVLQLFWSWQARVASIHLQPAAIGQCMEAFLEFELSEHAAQAVVQRHGTMVTTAAGIFQLSVQQAGKAEWEAVVAARENSDGIVKVKGVPSKAQIGDVLAFLEGFRVKPGGVHVPSFSDNRHMKCALVEFESAEEARRALQEKDRQQFGATFGDRYCLLQLISRAQFEQELRIVQRQTSGSGGASSSSGTMGASSPQNIAALSSAALGTPSFGGSPGPGALHVVSGPCSTGMLPQAAASAAGFMQPVLPPFSGGVMLPAGYAMRPAMAPMPGSWPVAAAVPAAAHMHLLPAHVPVGVGHLGPMGAAALLASRSGGVPRPAWPGMPAPHMLPNTAAARYMVQDLTTGQRVFLDPRFNLAGNDASYSAVATAGTSCGNGATGPAVSQQTQTSGQGHGSGGQGCGACGEQSLHRAPENGGNGHSSGASAKALDGKANGSSGQSAQTGKATAGPEAEHRHCHAHHHSHHHRHHHHHHHVRDPRSGERQHGSGDEGRTNGGSGGGSNDGSANGSGADVPADMLAAAGGGSSGDGSGADGGDCASCQPSRRDASMEDVEARCQGTPQPPPLEKDPSRLHSPVLAASLAADGLAEPPVKRTRSQ